MMTKKPCCGGNPSTTQPPSLVVESYGLCLQFDEFIENKAIWVVDLKDGTRVFQDDERPGLHTPSAWKRLGYYAKDYPDNPIVKMRLRFGTHIVGLPSNQPFYFYSRGLLQGMTQTHGMSFHIVGGPNDTGSVTCVWYKTPELEISDRAMRQITDCQPEQIIGDLTNLDLLL